ncbi:protein BatD [candidate division KSB1 bacterium]|nr:protein BatD [candidate division KSB1 bacterium]
MHRSIFILLAGLMTCASAQVLQVAASVDRSTVGVNQRLALTITLSGEAAQKVGRPTPPDLGESLKFLGSSGTSQNIQFVNGRMSVEMSSTFFYQALKTGRVILPPIKVVYQNKEYASNPIEIEIVASTPGQPTPGSSASGRDEQDLSEMLFVRTLVNKTRVYQNEPVLVTYRIYTQVNVTGYALTQLPETAGFWVEEIDAQAATREEVYQGKRYTVADIKKLAVFPASSGSKTIGPMGLSCDVRLPSQRRSRDIFDSFFDDPFFRRTVKQTLYSPAVTIEVLPLPDADKPAGFSGAVGRYTLDASVDRREVKANEAISLTVKLAGQGNIKTLPVPNLQLSSDFEQYEPKISQKVQADAEGVRGSKTFEYVLIPRFPGEQKIKSIEFVYFDLVQKRYRTLKTPEITVQVAQGEGSLVSLGPGLSKEEVRLIGQDIRFIKLKNSEFQPIGRLLYMQPVYLALLIVPFLVLMGAVGYQRYSEQLNRNQALARSKQAGRQARKRLGSAHKALKAGSGKVFYAELSRALLGFVSDKLDLAEAGVTSDIIEKRLVQKNIDREWIDDLLKLLQTCDYFRFGLGDSRKDEMAALFQQAKTLLVKLEKIL